MKKSFFLVFSFLLSTFYCLGFSYGLNLELSVKELKIIDLMRWKIEQNIHKNGDVGQLYRQKIIKKLDTLIASKKYENFEGFSGFNSSGFAYVLKIVSLNLLPVSSITENNVYYLKKNLILTGNDNLQEDVWEKKTIKELCVDKLNFYTGNYKYTYEHKNEFLGTRADLGIWVNGYFVSGTVFSYSPSFLKLKDQVLIVFYQPRDCETARADVYFLKTYYTTGDLKSDLDFFRFRFPVGLSGLIIKEKYGIKMLYTEFNSGNLIIKQRWYPTMDFYEGFGEFSTEPRLELFKQEIQGDFINKKNVPEISTVYEKVFLEDFTNCWSFSCGDLNYQGFYDLVYQDKRINLGKKYFVHSFEYEKEYDKKVELLSYEGKKYFVTHQFGGCGSCGVASKIFGFNNGKIFGYKIFHRDLNGNFIDRNSIVSGEKNEQDVVFVRDKIKIEISPKKRIGLCFGQYSNGGDTWSFWFGVPDDIKKQIIFEKTKDVYCGLDGSLCGENNKKCF